MAQLLSLESPSEEAVQRIIEALACAGLRVTTSFDLRTARAAQTECACPHHGTTACDCQLVVMLAYGTDACPATLVVHGRDGRSYLSLADDPGQRPSPEMAATILAALSPGALSRHGQAQAAVHAP